MAFAVDVQLGTNVGSSSAATTVTLTTTNTVAAGSLIILGAASVIRGSTTITVSGGGLTWTTVKVGGTVATTDDLAALSWAPAPAGLASGTVITVTTSPTNEFTLGPLIGAMAFTGPAASPLDAHNAASGSSSATWDGGSITPTSAGELICVVGWGDGASTTNTPNGSLTQGWIRNDATNLHTLAFNYQLAGSAGAQSPGGTWGASETQNRALSFSFLPAAATPVSPPQRSPLGL